MLNSVKKQKIADYLKPLRGYIALLGAYSFFVNLLLLVPVMYMVTVFDRAVSSRSTSTLLMLTIIMLLLMVGLGMLTWARSVLAQRAAAKVYRLLSTEIFEAAYKRSVYSPQSGAGTQTLADLYGLRRFIASATMMSIFDAPFTPIFIIVMFLFHVYFGLLAVFALVVLVVLNIINERTNTVDVQKADAAQAAASSYAQRNFSNAEVIEAMGIVGHVRKQWERDSDKSMALQVESGERAWVLGSVSRTLRLVFQSLALGLGAWLAINQQISVGMMIAGSILLGRALAPVDGLIGGWGGFVSAREQFSRVAAVFENMPAKQQKTKLPAPRGSLAVEKAVVAAPGGQDPIIKGISFALQPGSHLGIVGPSGAGKSSLGRALLGLWPCLRGAIRLDGAELFQWDREDLGPYIGYLPQDMELLDGSISDNIARMGEWKSEDVVEAAKLADVHDLILRLPKGYDTIIGSRNGALSGGQLQRIGLARALYGNPKYVILDEPNTNLDQAGERALLNSIKRLKAMGTTLIVISHNVRVLAHLDSIMVLRNGQIADFGQAGKILASYEKTDARDATAELTEKKKPPVPEAVVDASDENKASADKEPKDGN